jgi:hypothetical protein
MAEGHVEVVEQFVASVICLSCLWYSGRERLFLVLSAAVIVCGLLVFCVVPVECVCGDCAESSLSLSVGSLICLLLVFASSWR